MNPEQNPNDFGGAVAKLLEAFNQPDERDHDLRTLVASVLRLQRRVAWLEEMVTALWNSPPEPLQSAQSNDHASTKGETTHGT